jgi:hypothetical protein
MTPPKVPRNAVALVVGQDEKDVRRALRWDRAWRPPNFRVLDAFLEDAAEGQRRRRDLFATDNLRSGGYTGITADLLGWRWHGDE